MDRFLDRNGLSIRRFHKTRRSAPDDNLVSQFIQNFQVAQQNFDPKLIINADETNWLLLPNGLRTVARKGVDGVTCHFDVGDKESITVMAAIALDGTKLPLLVICKGTTQRCETKITNCEKLKKYFEDGKLLVVHSSSGWAKEEVCQSYLEWLHHGYAHDTPFSLLWDVYPSHRTDTIKQYAADNDIQLNFIPPGQTGEWQPLDYRIFGSLKARARAAFNRTDAVFEKKGKKNIKWEIAIGILMQCWEEISKNEVIKAWSHLVDNPQPRDITEEEEEEEDSDDVYQE